MHCFLYESQLTMIPDASQIYPCLEMSGAMGEKLPSYGPRSVLMASQ